jgi:hypothetical protein
MGYHFTNPLHWLQLEKTWSFLSALSYQPSAMVSTRKEIQWEIGVTSSYLLALVCSTGRKATPAVTGLYTFSSLLSISTLSRFSSILFSNV